MKMDTKDWLLWDALKDHFGHDVKIACYGHPESPNDVCLECETCNEVILDAEIYTLSARKGIWGVRSDDNEKRF